MGVSLINIITSIIGGLCILGFTSTIFIARKCNSNNKEILNRMDSKLDRNAEKTIESNFYLKNIDETLKENGKLLQELLRSKWN